MPNLRNTSTLLLCWLLCVELARSLSFKLGRMDRRRCLSVAPTLLLPFLSPQQMQAVVMENTQTIFSAGQPLGIEEAKLRFKEARKSLDFLLENYDNIAKGGGDNVRRYLGTVGTSSALYGISKVMKELQDEANDIVEYTENMNDFDYSLRAADTAVYSANFVEFSAAKTKPEKFFEDALFEAKRMKKYMDAMAVELNLN